MIFRDNLFSGALGKLSNIGGSRAWMTPHTVRVEPEAPINVPVTLQGDLVAHSLDGRLWFYRRSKRLGIIALKWNSETAKLEYAAALNLTNNSDVILVCGLDWILTNNNIFIVADDEPYIRYTNLFDADTPFLYLYSLLRDKSNGASGTDPLTCQAWGMREDNGNSEGNAYFMKSTHLLYPAGTHTFEQCYSLLPAVGDWQIFENFLVKRPLDVQTIQSYNYMHALRPLIPLEFSQGTAYYGSGYNLDTRGFQLLHRNGEIFGRGFQNIGKVSLLPAVFDENGTVQEYYLYIHPDFSFYPYSDFFYCSISTFDVNPKKKILEELEEAQDAEGLAAYEAFLQDYEPELHSFAVSILPRTWKQAKAACEVLGGHLATSTSEEKNSFLTSLIGSKNVWLGGTDEAKERAWVWINGEEWSYANWASNQPDNSDWKEHYLELYPAGTWNDANASASHYYICEWDYVLDENDFLGCLWQNISLAPLGSDALYGFLPEQTDAVNSRACMKSADGRVFDPQSRDFLTLSDKHGQLFFDILAAKGLWLEEDCAQFLFGDSVSDVQSVECRTLPQWIAPAESIDTCKIEAVSDDYVAAAADNSVFLTSLATGFNRQLVSPNSVPLTARAFSDEEGSLYRLALYDFASSSNKKSFRSNRLLVNDSPAQRINWQDIYKQPVNFDFVTMVDIPYEDTCDSFIWDNDSAFDEDNVIEDGGYSLPWFFLRVKNVEYTVAYIRENIYSQGKIDYDEVYVDESFCYTAIDGIEYYDTIFPQVLIHNNPYPALTEVFGCIIISASATALFLNPDDGSVQEISFSKNFSHSGLYEYDYGHTIVRFSGMSRVEVPYGVGYVQGNLGFYGFLYDREKGYNTLEHAPMVFFPCVDFPEFMYQIYPRDSQYIEPSISTLNPIIGWDDQKKPCSIIFQEQSSGIKFIQKSYAHQNSEAGGFLSFYPVTCANYNTKFTDSAGVSRSKKNFHFIVATKYRQAKLFLFRSEVFPEVFDFPAEIERSK